jgi:hypothetical protein
MKLKILGPALLGLLVVVTVGVLGYSGAIVGSKLYFLVSERSWPSTTATITSTRTIVRTLKYGNQQWAPSWTYSYIVNGRSYSSDSTAVAHGYDVNWYRYESVAEREGLSRPVGLSIQTYYDPSNPSRSVLDRATFDLSDAICAAIFILVLAKAVELVSSGRRRAGNHPQ